MQAICAVVDSTPVYAGDEVKKFVAHFMHKHAASMSAEKTQKVRKREQEVQKKLELLRRKGRRMGVEMGTQKTDDKDITQKNNVK